MLVDGGKYEQIWDNKPERFVVFTELMKVGDKYCEVTGREKTLSLDMYTFIVNRAINRDVGVLIETDVLGVISSMCFLFDAPEYKANFVHKLARMGVDYVEPRSKLVDESG